MSDSIQALTREICAFREERDWLQFHNPREMAVATAESFGRSPRRFDQKYKELDPNRDPATLARYTACHRGGYAAKTGRRRRGIPAVFFAQKAGGDLFDKNPHMNGGQEPPSQR